MLSSLTEYEGYPAPSQEALALGLATVWPRTSWGSSNAYAAALHGMARLHANWWGKAQKSGPWPLLSEIYSPEPAIAEARRALLSIEREGWASKLLGEDGVSALLGLLDEPSIALELLQAAPVTLIAPAGPGEQDECDRFVCAGPAAYDLASFYASSRWLYGRTPIGLVETRNAYLSRLCALLSGPFDHALFDVTLDAARCWSFALGWTQTIATRPPALLARAQIFRSALAEPAIASIRRLQRI